MKSINLERAFFIFGLISSISASIAYSQSGFSAWSWPLACAIWIGTAWIKTERIESLTKNK
jgi:hypothetical protein